MKSLETIALAEFFYLGNTEVLLDNENKKVLVLHLYRDMCGVKTFSFVFIRRRRTGFIYIPVAEKRRRVIVEDRRVEITTLLSKQDFHNSSKLVSLASKTIDRQIKGNNSEMLALSLFYNVSRIDPLVKPPILVDDMMSKPYDIKVPVISSRSKGSVLVPVQVKSGYAGQAEHMRIHPHIPSVVVNIESVASKVLAAKELLSKYVNQGVALHI